MTTDTSTEAVERAAEQCRQRSVQDSLIHTESWQRLCNEFGAAAALLRALSRERDSAHQALQYILDGHIGNALDDVKGATGYTPAQQRAVFEGIQEAAQKGIDGTFKTHNPFERPRP